MVPRLLDEFSALLDTLPNTVRALKETYVSLCSNPFLSAALPAPPDLSGSTISPSAVQALLTTES
jgi:hypothetical protein